MQKSETQILSDLPLTKWKGSLTTFDGARSTTPKEEMKGATWDETSDVLRPNDPLVIEDKIKGTFILPCRLRKAPLVGKTLEAAERDGKPIIGKMRSKNHVIKASMPMFDIDGMTQAEFEALLETLRNDCITYLIYTTHSHGDQNKPGMRIRLGIPIDRPVGNEEYRLAWLGFNHHYLNGKADPSGAKLCQLQGIWSCHPSRVDQAKFWFNDAGVVSTDALIQLGLQTHQVQSAQDNQSEKDSNKSYPPSDANKIADKCNQIREFRDTKGAKQSEPLWRDCLGAVGHCQDGENLCQEWSSGHPGYDKSKTAEKLAARMKFPPTTCDQFKKTNPAGCEGCVQQCKSPITLGRKDSVWFEKYDDETDVIKPDKPITSHADIRAGSMLEKVQQQFQLLKIGGRVWLLDSHELENHNRHGTSKKLSLYPRNEGSLLLKRMIIAESPQSNAAKVVQEFFESPGTTCFDGIEFNPADTSENTLNLWTGPTIDPKQGEWKLIDNYLLEVICDGDEKSHRYLIRFIAHALQKPEEKPGILVVLLGGQGTGKGTLGKILRKIWGATYLQVHNIDAVTGNFNASLECAFIVFMDEALFSGDRRATDQLKSLVTEPVIYINEKHQPARQTASYHRFFAATNADHFKNTERDDRRDFVLRLSETRKGDHDYWKALNHEIENGGVEAMTHDLLAMDLSDFNVRDKPGTKELLRQKLHSLGPIERWWHDCLMNGGMSEDDDWPDFIGTRDAIRNILEVSGGRVYKKPIPSEFIDTMKKLCPSVRQMQKKDGFSSRQRGLGLPSLEQARTEFEAYLGGSIEW